MASKMHVMESSSLLSDVFEDVVCAVKKFRSTLQGRWRLGET